MLGIDVSKGNSDLNGIKVSIESMEKYHQVEILRIIKKYPQVTLNQNNNGIFINLSLCGPALLEELQVYMAYVDKQMNQLDELEIHKALYKQLLS